MTRKRKSRKRILATLDFETDPFKHGTDINPFCVGLYTEDDYWEFWGDDCASKIAELISDKNLRIYAHNGGRFDYFFLMQWLKPHIFLINNRIAKCEIGDSLLLDSYLIFPMPLSAYRKDEMDYKIMDINERNKPKNKKRILNYLHKDCVYLYEWVKDFIDDFGTKLTISQAAFDQLDKMGYPCKRRSSVHYDTRLRKFYFGGRTEAIKTGFFSGTIKYYDINSAYSYAMCDYHPFGTAYMSIQKPKNLPKSDFYFATIKAISKGCLPVKNGTTVTFPRDDTIREYHTTSWEIRAGLETGTLDIISVEEVFIWEETRHFRPYVERFFDEKAEGKKEGDIAKTQRAKLMLVSPYGKFGADPRKYKKTALCDWDELPFDEDEEIEMLKLGMNVDEYIKYKEWTIEGDTDFGKTFWSRPDPGDSFFNVAVAASITGHVRARLWQALCESEDPLYCDTDSVICREFYGELGDKLGQWDFEAQGNEGIYIGGKKLYAFLMNYCKIRYFEDGSIDKTYNAGEIKKAHKGARLSYDEIVSIVLDGKTIHWENDAPSFSLSAGMRYIKRDIKMTQ